MTYRKKLIEVALPLDAINREASLRKRKAPAGYPTTLHKWWAQRPVAACRAVVFASLVDDPSSCSDRFPTAGDQDRERLRLFSIIEDLIRWESSMDNDVLNRAMDAIAESCGAHPPLVRDPFCGSGAIPLEAVRLGLPCVASDLNPVAVLITKALTEIPNAFAGLEQVGSGGQMTGLTGTVGRATGMAADIRAYGATLVKLAHEQIAEHYPVVTIPNESGGGTATPVAWLWANVVTCPNPACGADLPLIQSFLLSARGDTTWLNPVVDRESKQVRFDIATGHHGPPPPPKAGRGGTFRCLVCGEVAAEDYLKTEGMAGRMRTLLTAMVGQVGRRRVYFAATDEHVQAAAAAQPGWHPNGALAYEPRAIWCTLYGLTAFSDLFTPRQTLALTTLIDCLPPLHTMIAKDAAAAGLSNDDVRLADGGHGARAYADAIVTYLALALGRCADYGCRLATWRPKDSAMRSGLAKQALPFTWDFAEGNPFGPSSSGFAECVDVVATCVAILPASNGAHVHQLDISARGESTESALICTDPPYYDNIGYSDLADFFYVWLRPALRALWPDLFSTLLTPKKAELIASPYRLDGDKRRAREFFETGLHRAFDSMLASQHPDYPMTIFYAFKQSENDAPTRPNGPSETASTGWETMLEGMLRSGLMITGTWPVRTEGDNRQVGIGTNALASSIVLVCRRRVETASIATRRDLIRALRAEMPAALRELQQGGIAPVDLAQSAIGPGMAIFSRYERVLDADGEPIRVRTALALINQVLDEVVTEEEGELDADTRWALAWFEEFGFVAGPFGAAETLSKAKNTSLSGLVESGIATSVGGKVRLLPPDELRATWAPKNRERLTIWEITHHIIRALSLEGEAGGSRILQDVGGLAERARDLAYRLYLICDRKNRPKEALAYNTLVISWPDLLRRGDVSPIGQPTQQLLEA